MPSALQFGTHFEVEYLVVAGAGGVAGTPEGIVPTSGSNSVFHNIQSFGGGRGFSRTISFVSYDASSGGSGGGQGDGSSTRFLGIPGQGNSGGVIPSAVQAGGGGGAGTPALLDFHLFNTRQMNGGNGMSISITGTSLIYAGGGGGGDGGLGGHWWGWPLTRPNR